MSTSHYYSNGCGHYAETIHRMVRLWLNDPPPKKPLHHQAEEPHLVKKVMIDSGSPALLLDDLLPDEPIYHHLLMGHTLSKAQRIKQNIPGAECYFNSILKRLSQQLKQLFLNDILQVINHIVLSDRFTTGSANRIAHSPFAIFSGFQGKLSGDERESCTQNQDLSWKNDQQTLWELSQGWKADLTTDKREQE